MPATTPIVASPWPRPQGALDLEPVLPWSRPAPRTRDTGLPPILPPRQDLGPERPPSLPLRRLTEAHEEADAGHRLRRLHLMRTVRGDPVARGSTTAEVDHAFLRGP